MRNYMLWPLSTKGRGEILIQVSFLKSCAMRNQPQLRPNGGQARVGKGWGKCKMLEKK
jgi:hypothetical protein